MNEARWSPGNALTFVWPGGTLMLGVDLEGDTLDMTVDRIWTSLTNDVTLSGILQLLTDVLGASLLNLPDFAVALFDGPAGQFAARGRFQVEVGRAVGKITVEGLGVTTWSERAIEGIEWVALGQAGVSEGFGLPLRAGVVRASRVAWGEPVTVEPDAPIVERPPASQPAHASQPAPADLAAPSVSPPEPEASGSEADDEPDRIEDAPSAMTLGGSGTESSGATTVVNSGEDDEDKPGVEETPGSQADQELAAEPSVPGPSRFAALWGDTAAYSIEEAAVRLEEEEPAKPGHAAAASPRPESVSETSSHRSASDEPDIISAVPGRAGSAPAQSAPATQDWSDHDGETVVGFSIATATPEPAHETDSETVLALVCPAGHSNRPHRGTCRECGAALSAGLTQTVPRPKLGQIRSSTGEIVPLTGPVLIGRSPRAARFQGTVSPKLLSLPYQHISSTHLEVRLEGWNVFAVDLNSMNGAYLRRRDEPPVRVTHVPLMLADGDVIDFGHGVSVAFEGMP